MQENSLVTEFAFKSNVLDPDQCIVEQIRKQKSHHLTPIQEQTISKMIQQKTQSLKVSGAKHFEELDKAILRNRIKYMRG